MEAILTSLLIVVVPLLLAVILHEYAHASVALYYGDHTALEMGRFSLNPLKYIDLFGTILLPIVLYFATNGKFIFAVWKNTPVNVLNLRNPKRHMGLVALAGPASNLVQAFLWMSISLLLPRIWPGNPFLAEMAISGLQINLIFFIINLLPLPPFDGGRILISVLPERPAKIVARLEPYGFVIFIGLILIESFTSLALIRHSVAMATKFLMRVLYAVASFLFTF